MTAPSKRERYELLYRELYGPIAGYVLRRVGDPEDAAEAISETFLTLWRRLDTCPSDGQVRPWLFGVARKVLANQRRGEHRRSALAERLVAEHDPARFAPVFAPAPDDRVARAFATLGESDREVLALLAWEGLTREELSVALGASRAVVRLRLHRARRRFEAALERETRSSAAARIRLSEGGEET